MQREAYNRYGTMFTERNLSIVNAYNSVMGKIKPYSRSSASMGLSNG
nr:MAG TPA: hypothetical protein [Caudoviricetes sp.]